MSDDTLRLTDQEVLDHAQTRLAEHLPLEAAGYACTTEDLLKVLLGVATHTSTVESVCADLVGSPSPETIRAYFNEQVRVEDLPDLEARLNAALAAEIPERVRCRACEVAIDLHDRPYYGKTEQAEGLWVRGQAKEGTTRFYRVASAWVMLKHLRVTVAARAPSAGADAAIAPATPFTAMTGQPSRLSWPCAACSPPPNAPAANRAKPTG